MSFWITVTRVAMGVNILLLVGVGYVWVGNYRVVRSKYVLALLLFAVFLLAENVSALYLFSLHAVTRQWFEAAATTAQAAMGCFVSLKRVLLSYSVGRCGSSWVSFASVFIHGGHPRGQFTAWCIERFCSVELGFGDAFTRIGLGFA